MLFSMIFIHIISGITALLSGYAVIFIKKGKSVHKYLGQFYVLSMITLGISGTYVAALKGCAHFNVKWSGTLLFRFIIP